VTIQEVQAGSSDRGETRRPSREDVFSRAEALVPALLERAERAEELGRLPEETMADLSGSGLFGLVSPRSDGGWGYGIGELGEVTRILAKGCASTAWVYSFYMVHHSTMVLTLPSDGRRAVMGDQPYGLAASSAGFHALPSGTAERVDGGWRLNGKWPFASGVMNCDWIFLVSSVGEGEQAKPIGLAVPTRELTVHDVWHFSGMKATGSNTVSAADVFVPDHLIWRIPEADSGSGTDGLSGTTGRPETPHLDREDFPLGHVSPLRIFDIVLPAVAVGAAEAALEFYKDNTHKRIVAFGVGPQIEHREAWSRYAEAWSWVDLAELLWRRSLALMEGVVASGQRTPPVEAAAALRLASSRICRLARDGVQTMMDGGGTSVHHTTHPLQRIQRDVDVLKSHNYLHWDGASTQAGQALLGLEPPFWLVTA
jgi:alkylation response protein AidB-like acyl-CoA dehydrogenase